LQTVWKLDPAQATRKIVSAGGAFVQGDVAGSVRRIRKMLVAVTAQSFRTVCKIFGNSTHLTEINELRVAKT